MKKLKSILRTAVLLVAGLALGVQLYFWNARSLVGNALPMPFGYGAAVVLTGSMEPTIMVDDLIVVKKTESFEIGDIVVFQNGNLLVVHRIVDMDEQTVTTRGDANNAEDTPISSIYIKGKVVGHVRGVGAAVRMIKSPIVTFGLIAGAVLLVEMPYRKTKKQDDDDLEALKAEIRKLKDEL
ncbi:MAG: signal peptidase I [Oscillospiraceae bacterium]|nr:signal peptidase I [Oscillospiraceae bacterium]